MRAELLTIWAVLAGVVIIAWAATRPTGCSLGGLIGAIGSRRVGLLALWLGWAWLGWHFLAR